MPERFTRPGAKIFNSNPVNRAYLVPAEPLRSCKDQPSDPSRFKGHCRGVRSQFSGNNMTTRSDYSVSLFSIDLQHTVHPQLSLKDNGIVIQAKGSMHGWTISARVSRAQKSILYMLRTLSHPLYSYHTCSTLYLGLNGAI